MSLNRLGRCPPASARSIRSIKPGLGRWRSSSFSGESPRIAFLSRRCSRLRVILLACSDIRPPF